MFVAALTFVYVVCCGLLLYVFLQDRANVARARRKQQSAARDPRTTHTPELVFRTQA